MNRRYFLQCLGISTFSYGLSWIIGCERAPTLTVELHQWVGYETLYLARYFNWLPESVSFHDDLTLGESLAALRSGKADAACMTLDEMLHARASGLPLSAALVFDVSAGADMVMARPEIETLADLKEKRIGLDPETVGNLVFIKLLEAAELPPSAVIKVDLPPAMQLDAWRRGEVDAVITYQPFATSLMHEGAHNLFDSRAMPNTIVGVLAVRHDHPKVLPLIRTVVAAHFRALDYIHNNEEDSISRLSVHDNITPEEVRLALASVTLPSLDANRGYLLGNRPILAQIARNLSRLMVRHGLLAKEDDLQDLILPYALPNDEW
jgi:NitT/TauT family transport system substrate-binding protein